MAVTKRIRFEVLKRDNYTCRYCRSTEGKLTVDHVTPVALGGSDKVDNLVAACTDCNAGKSSMSPGAAVVEDVKADALRYAQLAKAGYALMVEEMSKRDDYIDEVSDAFGPRWQLPENWRNSIGRWYEMGVPAEILIDAATIAARHDRVANHGAFKYFCGIAWSRVTAVTQKIEDCIDWDGRWFSEEEQSNERIDAYEQGYRSGLRAVTAAEHSALESDVLLRLVIDTGRHHTRTAA